MHCHGVRELSDATAEILGRRHGPLCLKGVESLTPLQSQLLAGHRGSLYLDRVDIGDAVAVCLGQHEGSLRVRLEYGITPGRLEGLVQHHGPLTLGKLTRLDDRTATILAAQPGRLGGAGLAGLAGLFLDDIEHLTPPVAAILATHRAGSLSLAGLTLRTEEVATALVPHPLLALDGLTSVTDRMAAILTSRDDATISLKGLRNLSTAALAKLRGHPGIELPKHLRDPAGPTAPKAAAAGPRPGGKGGLIRAIQRIAHQGEAMLQG